MSKAAVVVDSVCTLPPQFLNDFHIVRVPIQIQIDGDIFPDPCDDLRCLELFQADTLGRKRRITTDAPTQAAFEQTLHELIDAGFQSIWVQTVNRQQSATYDRASAAVARVSGQLPVANGVSIHLMDSRAVMSGQALLATESIRRLQSGEDPSRIQRTLEQLATQVHTFVLSRDPMIAADRRRTRGERMVQWSRALIAKALGIHPILCLAGDRSYQVARIKGFDNAVAGLFRYIQACIESGQLSSPVITVHYAGSLTALRALPGYVALEQAAKTRKCQWIPSVASLAGGIYASAGSLMVSVSGHVPEWETAQLAPGGQPAGQ